MAVMGRTGTKRLVIKKEGGFELELERQDSIRSIAEPMPEVGEEIAMRQENAFHRTSRALSKGSEVPIGATLTGKETQEETASIYVTSPMVGTFYASPSPDDPPFVKVGEKIEKHTVVCIIEAMKVMNEVKAGVSGTVAEVLIESGHPIEFGTKLFRIS